jgi:hypothetical protein
MIALTLSARTKYDESTQNLEHVVSSSASVPRAVYPSRSRNCHGCEHDQFET